MANGTVVYKMFRAEKKGDETLYHEIGTAFLRPNGETIGLQFNHLTGDFVAFKQKPKAKGEGGDAKE